MEDTLKKILNASLGMAIIARNKVNEIINELVDKGKMSQAEGEKFINDLKSETEKSRKTAEDEIRKVIAKVLEKMDIPTKEEFDRLEKRVKALEKDSHDAK